MLIQYKKLEMLLWLVIVSIVFFIAIVVLPIDVKGEKNDMINTGDISRNILVGMSFEEVKKYLELNSIEYFMEDKGDAVTKSDQDAIFHKQIIFGVVDKSSPLDVWEKKIIFIVRLNKELFVKEIIQEEGYSGL